MTPVVPSHVSVIHHEKNIFQEAIASSLRVPEWDTWLADPNLICSMEPNLAENKQGQPGLAQAQAACQLLQET